MPSHTDYANRREAYCAWLTANHISPKDVLQNSDVYLDTAPDGSQVIIYEGCVLDSEGRRQLDERVNRVATEQRTTPLLAAPPPWWEPYRKPTRDQLLAVVNDLRKLIDDGPPTDLAVQGEWENGYSSALEAVEAALAGKEHR